FSKLINHPENKWPLYFLLLISVLIIFKFHWLLTLIIFGYLSYAISFSIYLDIFYRFPARVAHPILIMCASFVILLIFHLWSHKFPAKNTNHSILATTFILGVFWFLFNIGMHHNISKNTAFELSLNRLQSAYQGKILYIPPLVLQWEKMDPLKRYHFNFQMISAGGTDTFSPSFYKSLEKLGVKKGYEMIPALINNPNAYVIEMKTNPYCVTHDMMENDNLKCRAVVIEQLPNGRVILKLKPKRTSLWK
ncbi:hypothetical protein QUF54_04935, partial [Candidatus Marithioploca araucensis]|nr:hypothetical protein [Candidatus Marithioploca araucensis]